MMKRTELRFSIKKYLKHRQEHQGLTETCMDTIRAFDTMLECEGWTIDKVRDRKGCCLEEWCEEHDIWNV